MQKTWSDLGIELRHAAARGGGEQKTTCPRCSHLRKKSHYPCLNVNLDLGVWNCWHCGWSGSLRAGEFAAPAAVATRHYRRPDYVAAAAALPERMVAWFAERKIGEIVLRRNQVALGSAYFPQIEAERACILFPYRRRGECINIKYRTRDKLFRMEGGAERILYGLDDVDATRLYWVEGEIDKLSLEVAGILSCVSVPDGAPAVNSKSYESKFDFLDAPEVAACADHVIAVDNDPPGLRLRDELVRRLGPERCRIVDWPDGCKDANDVLMQYDAQLLRACLEDARELPIVGAHEIREFAADVERLYRDGMPRGLPTGWAVLDELYTVRPGDVTLITGAPNSGKTEWLDALLINLAELHGWRFGVYSPEQGSAPEHIAKLAEKRQRAPFEDGPTPRLDPAQLDQALTWLNDHVMLIEPEEATLTSLLVVARSLVLRRGVRGIVLDPWNEIEHAQPRDQSETQYIGECLRAIRRFARAHQVHVWIVAHPHKLIRDPRTGQYPVVGPYEISGGANWHNKPDVIISIWRDRSDITSPVQLHVQKVRSKHVGAIGQAHLRYDRATGRYT